MMKRLVVDIHTHTISSGHAYGTIRENALAAKENGVALEVNNATIREGYKENCIENIRAYLSLCMKYKTNIYVGSDAHDPSFIGEFSCAERLLEETGFDEGLIINNSEEKFRKFIHFEAEKKQGQLPLWL